MDHMGEMDLFGIFKRWKQWDPKMTKQMDKTGWKTDDQPLDLEKLVNPRIMGMGKWDVSGIWWYDDQQYDSWEILGAFWNRYWHYLKMVWLF